jgi:hypothetical protein
LKALVDEKKGSAKRYVNFITVGFLSQRRNEIVDKRKAHTRSDWMTEGLEFESRWGKEFSVLHVVQTGSGAHQPSYSRGTLGSLLGDKAAGA